jgi:hypothetical protein
MSDKMNRVLIEALDKWADAVEEAHLAANEARRAANGKEDTELLLSLDAAMEAREEAVAQLHAALERKEALERRVVELEAKLEQSATESADKGRRQLQEMQMRVEEAETQELETRRLFDSLRVDCESQLAGRQECEREAAREKERLQGEIDTLRVLLEKARQAASDDQGAQTQLKILQEALEDTVTPRTFELPVQQLLSRVPSAGAGEMQALKSQLEKEAIKVRELKDHADKMQQVRKSQSSVCSGYVE